MQPRLVRPRMLVMVTRRTLRRTCLLRPDPAMNNLFLYLLAVTSQKYGVGVIAPGLLSTHEHLVLEIVNEQQLGDFLRDLHRLVALCTKALRKWEGAVWDHEQTSVVHLRTTDAVVDKLAYVMANPVAAGLVHKASLWPGVQTLPRDLGARVFVASKPTMYLEQEGGAWPDEVLLPLVVPEQLKMTAGELREAVARRLEELQEEARLQMHRQGRRFLGARKARRVSPYARARGLELTRKRNPTFAVGRGNREEFLKACEELRTFRRAYREAFLRWRGGDRDTVFPAGTLMMRTMFGVRVAPG